MSTIVVNPKNKEELQFLSELLQKLKIHAKVFSEEDIEDVCLSLLMKETDRSEFVSEEEIMEKLKS